MVLHRSSAHLWSNCCSCKDELLITNMGGEQILRRGHVLAPLNSEESRQKLVDPLAYPLLLLTPLWLLFCGMLPFIFSLIDILSYIKKLGCGFTPGHRFLRESGFPCVLTTEVAQYFSEDRLEDVCLCSMNKSTTPTTAAGKVPVLELTWHILAHSALNEDHLTSEGEGTGRSAPITYCCSTNCLKLKLKQNNYLLCLQIWN